MLKEEFCMKVEAIGADDCENTYEIRRQWGGEGRKALVIELYPTLTPDKCHNMDVSTMHLLNHARELGWNDVRIVNLYSKVFAEKPKTGDLADDYSNLSYIEEILEEDDIQTYDIVIAWGNTLLSHMKTILAKTDVLSMIKDKGLANQVKCLVTDSLDTNGVHPLYLGLRHSKDLWKLKPYPLDEALRDLGGREEASEKTQDKSKGRSKKNTGKRGNTEKQA